MAAEKSAAQRIQAMRDGANAAASLGGELVRGTNLPVAAENSNLARTSVKVITSTPAVTVLAGLGGYAVAAATIGHVPLVGGIADIVIAAGAGGAAYAAIRRARTNGGVE